MAMSSTFASAHKQRRKGLDLTSQERAQQAGCAAVTPQRIEQGTLRPSRQIVHRLADSLKVAADERAHVVRLGRSGSLAQVPGSRLHVDQTPAAVMFSPLPMPLAPVDRS